MSKPDMQNDATTAIDLFGPFNWLQNGGDLRYEPEKVRKNGTQKSAYQRKARHYWPCAKKYATKNRTYTGYETDTWNAYRSPY